MAISKIILNGVTQMDVTGKTVTAASMRNGVTSLKNDGTDITGNIADMTLPSSASSTSSGTAKATVTPGSSAQYINIPTGYNDTAQYYTISAGGSNPVKTKTGTFTGNGTRQVEISCDFEPDLIYWSSDPGASASSGTVAGIIAREMMSANRYRNNSTTNTHYAAIDITAMNTNGSSYCFRATYANSTVTLYCFSSNARSLFTNGRTYSYKFVKWTT